MAVLSTRYQYVCLGSTQKPGSSGIPKMGLENIAYPEVGARVKCMVTKTSFAQATLRIVDIEGVDTAVHYKAILKGTSVGEEIYVCDKVKTGDLVECVVLSHGDNAIFVSLL